MPSFRHQFTIGDTGGVYLASQVHGDHVLEVTGAEPLDEVRAREADALFTYSSGVAVGVYSADCVPILIEDAAGSGCAAVHAGWRGLAAGVVQAAVAAMRGAPDRLRAALGPSIGPCCFEVGSEVAARFPSFVCERGGSARDHVDLHAAAIAALRVAGVVDIDTGRLVCTVCDPAGYPSYRRNGPGGPRMVHAIRITPGAS